MSTITNQIWPVHPDFSVFGAPIQLSSALTPGILLHTCIGTADMMDEVWLWAMNTSGADNTINITIGGTGMPYRVRSLITNNAPPKCLIPGWRLSGGLPVYGFLETAGNNLSVMLNVNRMLKVTTP